jgi:steroid delta-isomerase
MTEPSDAKSEPNDARLATLHAYFDALRSKDADAWAACFAADGIAHDPAHAPAREGRAAQREFLAGVAALFAEIDFTMRATYVCGDEAAVVFHGHCVAHNGRRVEVDGVDIFSFDSTGGIACVKGYWDPAPLFAAAQGL